MCISPGKTRPECGPNTTPTECDPLAVAKEIYADFNREHGTDYKFQLKQ